MTDNVIIWLMFHSLKDCFALSLLTTHIVSLVNVIIPLSLTDRVWPKVILLGGFHCIYHNQVGLSVSLVARSNRSFKSFFTKWRKIIVLVYCFHKSLETWQGNVEKQKKVEKLKVEMSVKTSKLSSWFVTLFSHSKTFAFKENESFNQIK